MIKPMSLMLMLLLWSTGHGQVLPPAAPPVAPITTNPTNALPLSAPLLGTNTPLTLPNDIAQIKAKNVIVVAIKSGDVPPFFAGEGDDIRGLDVEISKKIAEILKVDVKFKRDAKSFSEVVEQVASGNADIAVSKLSITGPRLQIVRFSIPYLTLRQSLVINRLWLSNNSANRPIHIVIRNFDGKVAFMKGSSYDTFARINFPKATFVPETDWNVVIKKVMSGEVAAGFRDEFEIKKISFENPEASLTTKSITISDSVDNIAVAVNFKSTHLLAIVDFVIKNEFSNIDTKKLMNRYKEESKLKVISK